MSYYELIDFTKYGQRPVRPTAVIITSQFLETDRLKVLNMQARRNMVTVEEDFLQVGQSK
jgi:hypothetical protein